MAERKHEGARERTIFTYRSMVLVLISFVAGMAVLHAENTKVLRGTVKESRMNEPVPFATVKILSPSDSSIVALGSANRSYCKDYHGSGGEEIFTGEFSIEVPFKDRYILEVSSPGYEPVCMNLDLSKMGRRTIYEVETVRLKPISHKLGEITVKASKVKFYHRGDTLVYNADAFIMAEGSMLDALIRQLPNVELKDNGEIYVNGRYVDELLLNGKGFFNDKRSLMLDNLGAFTVKNIELYDKESMVSRIAGTDMGDSRYVMDVKLKKEYMVGVNTNIEGGYGTHNRYMGRLFSMGFTSSSQFAAYFNINNLNDSRKPGQSTNWTPETMPTGVRRTVSGGVDYNLSPVMSRWSYNGSIMAESSHENDGTDITGVNFLSGGNTYEYRFNRSENKMLNIGTSHKLEYQKKGSYGMRFKPSLNYRRWNNYSGNMEAVLEQEYNGASMDFVNDIYSGNYNGALAALINRNIDRDRLKGHSIQSGASLWQAFCIPGSNDILKVEVMGDYTNRHDERFNRYEINFGQNPKPEKSAARWFKNYPNINSGVGGRVEYAHRVKQGFTLKFYYGYEHVYGKEISDLYNLDTPESVDDFMAGKLPSAIDYEMAIDRSNSFLSRQTNNRHKTGAAIAYDRKKVWIQYNIPVTFENQHLDYKRGRVDTSFTRRSVTFDIGNAFINLGGINGPWGLMWNTDMKSVKPDMVSMVDFTDDTNPLWITRGNRNLRNALNFSTDISYLFKFGYKHRNKFRFPVIYTNIINALSRGYTYDSATGVRTGSFHNVNGNWSLSGAVEYSFFGSGYGIYNSFEGGTQTSVDLVGYDSPALQRSKVYDKHFADQFSFTKEFGNANRAGLKFKGRHDRYSSNLPDFVCQNTWTLQTSATLLYNLPANFQIGTDLTMFNRRGYTDSALNTDNFVWNARLTYKALKGKLLLMLDGYDILHDLSNVSYTINAQARTETVRTVLPRYFMFHVQWRFNHNPAKK